MTTQDEEIQPENSMKQQLALAVRSIGWSYGVFWSLSTELRKSVCSPKASSVPHTADSDKDSRDANINKNESTVVDVSPLSTLPHSAEQMKFDQEIENNLYLSILEDFNIDSPDDCSNDSCHHEEAPVYGCTSSFVPWMKELTVDDCTMQESQSVLKKVLFRAPLTDAYSSTSSSVKDDGNKDYPLSSEAYDVYMQDFASQEATANIPLSEWDEKRENQLYTVHESTIPSITETDEAIILTDHTVEYLAGVDELESSLDLKRTNVAKNLNMLEQTSDSYNKSKASENNETDPDLHKANQMEILQPLDVDMEVSIVEHEVLITLSCPWREFLLIDIMETLSKLNLDTHTIQSSTLDGTLSVFLKSKFQRAAFTSEGMIKQALKGTIGMF